MNKIQGCKCRHDYYFHSFSKLVLLLLKYVGVAFFKALFKAPRKSWTSSLCISMTFGSKAMKRLLG